MTATAARATCASFSHCVRAAESRKSPQNSDFYGHRTTYSEKAHCIKDSVLLDPVCGSGTFLIEGAMMASGLAPGLMRRFSGESLGLVGVKAFKQERE
ncbi:MAG TPA: hypothetical protein VFC89_01105, partial [Oscillospiraceae bacterium]|nr:hypothetical protein [Oscillospiraceae bacterium]